MKTRTGLFCFCTCLAGTALFAGAASAQTKAFRQTNLASSVSGATQATLLRDDSAAGAVYTAVALLHPSCCAPYVAIADFSSGSVRTLNSSEPDYSPR